MEQKTGALFWIVCIITSLGAIVWSVTSLMQQPTPLFVAFLEKENPAIVAGFNKGYADERKSSKYDIISLTCQSK